MPFQILFDNALSGFKCLLQIGQSHGKGIARQMIPRTGAVETAIFQPT